MGIDVALWRCRIGSFVVPRSKVKNHLHGLVFSRQTLSLCTRLTLVCLLMIAGDIESNPGPVDPDLSKALTNLKLDILKELRDTKQEIKREITEIRKELKTVVTRCESLEKSHFDLKMTCETNRKHTETLQTEYENLAEQVNVRNSDIDTLHENHDDFVNRVEKRFGDIQSDMDQLESFSRRDNVILYGILEDTEENFHKCKQMVLGILNKAVTTKKWFERDIVRAHRLGYKSDKKQNRHMIVKFHHWDDKMLVLRARAELKKAGYGVSDDHTRRQQEMLRGLRQEGKRGYYKSGKLFVTDDSDERTDDPKGSEPNTSDPGQTSPQRMRTRSTTTQQSA